MSRTYHAPHKRPYPRPRPIPRPTPRQRSGLMVIGSSVYVLADNLYEQERLEGIADAIAAALERAAPGAAA